MTEPKWRRIARLIREELPEPGTALPSEATYVEKYDASRGTVRAALAQLEAEGLISSSQGSARIVRSREAMVYRPQAEKEPRRSATMDRFMTALTLDGREPRQTIEVAVEPADGIVAQRLDVEPGTPVAVRKRVRWIDGEPFNINDTYHHLELAMDTAVMRPADVPQGSNSLIEEKLGREVRAIDEFYVRMPTPVEVDRLRLGPGTPVVVHYCTGYTADDKVIRVEYFCLPGDRHVIVYERHHPEPETSS